MNAPNAKETLEAVTSWLENVTYGLTLAAAIAGLSFMFFNRRLQKVAKDELDTFKMEAQRNISAANEVGAKAHLDSAEARKEQEKLKQENLKLAIKHAALRKVLANRRLTASQAETLGRALSSFAGTRIILIRLGDDEAGTFADDILRVFESAGWRVEVSRVGSLSPPRYGVILELPPEARGNAAIDRLFRALAAIPIEVRVVDVAAGSQATLVIALKPTPRIEE
ncbi:MAG: hypothetical protein ACRD2K_00565 [Terriglobales bacterium]